MRTALSSVAPPERVEPMKAPRSPEQVPARPVPALPERGPRLLEGPYMRAVVQRVCSTVDAPVLVGVDYGRVMVLQRVHG